MIPGRALHRLSAQICSAKTLERVVEPAIADLQKEYCGAGNLATRVRVLLAGYFAILKVIAMCVVSVSLESADERRAVARTLAWSVTMVVLIAGLLMLPPLYSHRSFRGWDIATTLVPQALALAIPLGVAFGIAFGLCARPTVGIAKTLLVCAFAASLLNFGVLAWGLPAAHQAFREITRGSNSSPTKGYNEMTLPELRRRAAHFSANGEPRTARRIVFSFHSRFALAAAAFALASLLLAAPVSHRRWRGVFVVGVCVVYWALMFAGDFGSRRGYLPPPLGAWLPNLVMIAFAIVVAFSSSSRLRGSHGPTEVGPYR